MEQKEWLALADALKKCLNSEGTLHYDYDARLAQLIERYAPNNGNSDYPFIRNPDYETKGQEETFLAIDNWVKAQQMLVENSVIITSAQLELEDSSEAAMRKIIPTLIEQKRLLVRGVAKVNDIFEFPDWQADRPRQAKALFDVATRAIEVFQETPTALVLFPNLEIPDSRVFGGFYGSPWSTFNNRTLCLKFRNINPHFEINVCTVSEGRECGCFDQPNFRKVGMLFTYVNP